MSTWMLVEDESDLYEMILAMYDVLGIGGVAFATGEDATDWIVDVERGVYEGELPELALLDIRLPGDVNGLMVGSRMRESSMLSHTVIVLMTAFHLTPSEEQEAMDIAGADYLLYKPLPKIGELEKLLKGLVGGYY